LASGKPVIAMDKGGYMELLEKILNFIRLKKSLQEKKPYSRNK